MKVLYIYINSRERIGHTQALIWSAELLSVNELHLDR